MKIEKNKVIEALEYHSKNIPGKIEVIPTKPYQNQKYLSLAYSPGVAYPSLEIFENPDEVYEYTIKGNLVGIITNGTAVLGLGNIGPLAAKPVMEGKSLLLKTFADINAFDIEVSSTLPDKFINSVSAISNTFGAINLEDIKAPECFEIEQKLQEKLDIPVMHDDQHGTAIIVSAALLNAVYINGKEMKKLQVVINGAGAAAIATAKMLIYIGIPKKNIVMCDSKGVIGKKNNIELLNRFKAEFATEREISTLQEAVNGADVFIGLSKGNVLTAQMLNSMNANPIVFALANPMPEISYELVKETRNDVIFGTGRSDYPNQINNVLGFPYIFRGALDVRAKKINDKMKYAAAVAIANLAREKVPDEVLKAYKLKHLEFGKNYILPKPTDFRLISEVSTAVAKAAIESGVARFYVDGTKVSTPKSDEERNIMWREYKKALELRLHALKGICYRCKNGECI